MSLVWFDKMCGRYNLLANEYDGVAGNTDATGWFSYNNSGIGRDGGRCAYGQSNVNSYVVKNVPSNDTYTVGIAIYLGTLDGSDPYCPIAFVEGSTVHGFLGVSPSGRLQYLDSGGTQLAQSAAGVIVTSTWFFLECEVKIHDTTGYTKLWLDGSLLVTQTGLDTRNGGSGVVDNIRIGTTRFSNNTSFRMNDLYIINNLGSIARLQTALGNCQVFVRVPTGAGNYSDFTRAGSSPAATNWGGVDEIPPDGATDRNESGTVGHSDTFTGNTITGTKIIHGVSNCIVAGLDIAGSRTLSSRLRIGSTNYDAGGFTPPTGSYLAKRIIQEDNPATSAQFTTSEVNSMEFGYVNTA